MLVRIFNNHTSSSYVHFTLSPHATWTLLEVVERHCRLFFEKWLFFFAFFVVVSFPYSLFPSTGAEIEFTPKLPEAQPGSSLGSTAEPPADMPSPMISSRNALQQEGQQEQTQQQPAPTPQLPKSYVLVCRSDFSQKKKTEEDDAFDFMNITPVTVQSKSHTCAGVAPESVVRVVANGEDDFNIQTQ